LWFLSLHVHVFVINSSPTQKKKKKKKWIEKAGWFADLGTFDRNYDRVCCTPANMLSCNNNAASA